MKKLVALLLAGAIGASSAALIAGCGGGNSDAKYIDEKIEAGRHMTTEQLIEKAKEESGQFIAYGNTSRIADAMPKFIEKYGAQINLTTGSAEKKKDSEIYALLSAETISRDTSKNASVVLIQDSASLAAYREQTNMLVNYVPDFLQGKVSDKDLVPLAHQFINKLFIYNNVGNETAKFNNVWQLTEAKYKNTIYFKSPKSEQVNMNFLIMLTNDEWSGKLETAYKSYKGGTAATDVGEGKTYKNYGYKWIAEFLQNVNGSIQSDGSIAGALCDENNAGNMGLFVLSKLRDLADKRNNLNVSCWDKDASGNYVTIEPFAGFMYSIYAQIASNGPRPYTAMLFINYLMTEEGFEPWNTTGGYSANNEVAPKDTTDQNLAFYSQRLVVEDGEYIKGVKADLEDWINAKYPKA